MQVAAGMTNIYGWCSTPFGITEGGIRLGCPGFAVFGPVLNAFRHHRGGHARRIGATAQTSRCSTPFGITEGGMQAAIVATGTAKGCSTPFGITEGGIPITTMRSSVLTSAQRLSASQRGASTGGP